MPTTPQNPVKIKTVNAPIMVELKDMLQKIAKLMYNQLLINFKTINIFCEKIKNNKIRYNYWSIQFYR